MATEELEICPTCNGSGVGVADTVCSLCDGIGGVKPDNVVLWPGVTRVDTSPEQVLKRVVDADLEHIVVMGYTKEGAEFFASTYAGGPDVLWLLQRAVHKLMVVGDGEDD